MEEKGKNKINWDEMRKTGVLAFVLSLPVMVWKSTRIGRLIAWVTLAVSIFWFVGRLSDIVFEKFITRWEIRNESDKVLKSISEIKKNISLVGGSIDSFDSVIKQKIEAAGTDAVSDYREKLEKLDVRISGIDESISAIAELERASVKASIIGLRESVMLLKKDINSKEIRMEFEDCLKNMNILKKDERKRFKKDIKEMGFYVEEAEKKVRASRTRGPSISMDMFTPRWNYVEIDDSDIEILS